MKAKLLLASVLLVCLGFLMAGCGGGGGGETGGTLLTIGVDTFTGSGDEVRSVRATTLAAPLEDGAVVVVLNFETGREITRGTITGGFCTVTVPSGITVAVVVTGERGGKPYRLSTIIPVVPSAATEYLVTPVTTIAAEAVAQKYFRKSQVDKDTFDAALAAAQAWVSTHFDSDYSLGGGVIAGNQFGAADSLSPDISIDVPDISNDVVKAKNAVRQIREAGAPIELMLSQEGTDVASIFTEEVGAKYQALATALGQLIIPVVTGDMEFNGSDVDIFQLQSGKKYVAIRPLPDSIHLVLASEEAGQAGQITIEFEEEGETYTLVAALNGSTWTIEQNYTGDPLQEYVLTFPNLPEGGPGANPSLQASISLKDANFPTPLTFNGALSASGANPDSYTVIQFVGNLAAPQVTSSGTFRATFRSSIPAGARPEVDSIYEFPTSFSMSNASVQIKDSAKTITLRGDISVSMTSFVNDEGWPENKPSHVEINGAYTNTSSGLNFEGNIVGNWSNPTETDPLKSVATLTLNGTLSREGHPTYSADMTFGVNNGTVSSSISLRAGGSTLTGNGTGTLTAEGRIVNANLTLTNDQEVQFVFTTNASAEPSGSIKVGGDEVATIAVEDTGFGRQLRISYDDGTSETFGL